MSLLVLITLASILALYVHNRFVMCNVQSFTMHSNVVDVRNNDLAAYNILFILTDDQDVAIGGMSPLVRAQKLIGDAGIHFTNTFVTSPLCCPSRSSILTGRYVHNHGARNNSLSGNCSSVDWQHTAEKLSVATYLQQQGYRTFFAGKYLNEYGKKKAGGVEHIPPGWDDWHALVGNSVYYNYTLSVNGKAEKHGDNYSEDYLTNVIADRAVEFLHRHHTKSVDPFFMMLSTPACHSPFTPAPQYRNQFVNVTAPRNGSFNIYSKDKHWLVRAAKHPLSNESVTLIDDTYRNRLRTLLSVDDLVDRVVQTLDELKYLDKTYIVFASDNGYHLGQLSLPYDKRQMYEFDIRVPLMVRGPHITPGQVRQESILNIDLAPTFLDLAGINPAPSDMDGQSFKPLLMSPPATTIADWRVDFLVEHAGEVQDVVSGCPQLDNQGVGYCYPDCVCEDSYNNTYGCVRSITAEHNIVYCEFSDDENFVEVYDLTKDPDQLTNIVHTIDPHLLQELNQRLVKLSICAGVTCRTVHPYRSLVDSLHTAWNKHVALTL